MVSHSVSHSNLSSYKANTNQISLNQSVQQTTAKQLVQQKTRKKNLKPPISRFAPVAIIIPAYNEESCLGATLSSIFEQSVVSEQIIVVDDSSSDRTGEIAMSFDGVNVVRTPKNIGSKATALNYGLQHVNSKYTITVDADIKLEKNAVNKLVELMETQPHVSGICTFILPNKTKKVWEHERFVEYIYTLSLFKHTQDMYGGIVVLSGCMTIWRTQDLKSVGGWPTRTLAEDMELTWLLHENGKQVRYSAETICFAAEPETFSLLCKQVKRWYTGYFQILKLKWKDITKIPIFREFVIAGLSDAFILTIFLGGIIYSSISHHDPLRYLYYLAADITLLSIPSFWYAIKIKKVTQLAKSLPIYLVVRHVFYFWFIYSFISVFVLGKAVKKWEKGHK